MNAHQHLAPVAPDAAPDVRPIFAEFFAGAGMARAGLGPGWRCVLANDLDPMKAAAYRANWGAQDMLCADVATVSPARIAGRLDLAWASFPCQDLSLAGSARGLGAEEDVAPTRSGTFWAFWRLTRGLAAEGRAPRLIALENVVGALTSHGGRDFAAIGAALAGLGYRFGALVCDARHFTPQSRPRMFLLAAAPDVEIPAALLRDAPDPAWHTASVVKAQAGLSPAARAQWLWWRLPPPPERAATLADLIEEAPADAPWHAPEQTAGLLSMMTPLNRAKVDAARGAGRRVVGTLYRRTRADADGVGRQRVEVRFDGVAGCLRTPAGGSSRQTIIAVDGRSVRTRLMSAREAARLMGLPDSFLLPARYNDAYKVAGDGVAAPVVDFLARSLLDALSA